MKNNLFFLGGIIPKIGVTVKQALIGMFDYFNEGKLDQYNKVIVIFFNTEKGVFESTTFSNTDVTPIDHIVLGEYFKAIGVDNILCGMEEDLTNEGYPVDDDEPDGDDT